MKKLVKIQSITDVITNSSSEVFIMHKSVASGIKEKVEEGGEYCDIYEPLTMEYIEKNATEGDLWEMILEILNEPKGVVGNYEKFNGSFSWGWWRIDDEKWKTFFENNKERIQKEIVDQNYWIIEFEDHFENAYEVNEEARSYCIASKSHH